tara:strand:- start:3715 stop:3999 length:285 start_codon:yes stop_codon:yes gene_type:complete
MLNDLVGKPITENSYVVYSGFNNELQVGNTSYSTEKMVVIEMIPALTKTGRTRKLIRKYPTDVVVLTNDEFTAWNNARREKIVIDKLHNSCNNT